MIGFLIVGEKETRNCVYIESPLDSKLDSDSSVVRKRRRDIVYNRDN